jgi:hypothetical protein
MNGFPEAKCHNCGQFIEEGQERAIAIMPNGVPRHFCKFTGDDPDNSCWAQFRIKNAYKPIEKS